MRPSCRTGIPWLVSDRGLQTPIPLPLNWRRAHKTSQGVILKGGVAPQKREIFPRRHVGEKKRPPDAPWRDEGGPEEDKEKGLVWKVLRHQRDLRPARAQSRQSLVVEQPRLPSDLHLLDLCVVWWSQGGILGDEALILPICSSLSWGLCASRFDGVSGYCGFRVWYRVTGRRHPDLVGVTSLPSWKRFPRTSSCVLHVCNLLEASLNRITANGVDIRQSILLLGASYHT